MSTASQFNTLNVTKSDFKNGLSTTKYNSRFTSGGIVTPMGSTFVETLAPGSSSMSKYFPKKDRHAPLAANYNTVSPL